MAKSERCLVMTRMAGPCRTCRVYVRANLHVPTGPLSGYYCAVHCPVCHGPNWTKVDNRKPRVPSVALVPQPA